MPRFNPLKPAKAAKNPRPERLPKTKLPSPTPVSEIPILTENAAKDGLELRFGTKPSEAVLALFRGTRDLPSDRRWHWHFRGKFWYARRNPANRAFAARILGQPISPSSTPTPAVAPVTAPAIQPPCGQSPAPVDSAAADNVISVNFTGAQAPLPAAAPNVGSLAAWRARLFRTPTPL
jgi:hypothetical protein